MPRTARIQRQTGETKIDLQLDLDGTGKSEIATGIGFLDHMLTLLSKHSLIDLSVRAEGDLHVDAHHTVEDVGICLGKALVQALGDKAGIRRYGDCTLPMDETLVTSAGSERTTLSGLARADRGRNARHVQFAVGRGILAGGVIGWRHESAPELPPRPQFAPYH